MFLPKITEEEIGYAETATALTFADPDRREILTRTDTLDVWACPGSGKTSLLVGKLAILGRQWKHRHRGICVLSHTNVARAEIQKKLALTESRSLLDSPHFIGTIQSFVDQFLGIPAAFQRFGMRPTVIDTDRFQALAERKLTRGAYTKIRLVLGNRANRDALVRGIRFESADLEVFPRGVDQIGAGPTSDAYQQLVKLKEELAREGVFSYSDMYALAEWHLKKNPQIREALASRFPIVFIDEMQDTDASQWRLLEQVFHPRCTVQRFGDNHQSIFRSMSAREGVAFPGPNSATIRDSYRLSPSIAGLVGRITPGSPVQLVGNKGRADLNHGIIVFTRETVSQVLPFFAEQVIEQVLPIKQDPVARAVGAVGRRGEERNFPHSLGSYWPEYQVGSLRNVPPAQCIAERVQDAIGVVRVTRHLGELVHAIGEGLADILRTEGVTHTNGKPFTGRSLLRTLRTHHPKHHQRLADAITKMCAQALMDDSCRFELMASAYEVALAPLVPALSIQAKAALRRPARSDRGEALRSVQKAQSVYRHEGPGGSLDIRLSTIHAAKGETHDATLVLETFYKNHDLSKALDFAFGSARKAPSDHLLNHAKRLYVGASRPRYLLFFAICRDRVKASTLEKLEENGWNLHTITG